MLMRRRWTPAEVDAVREAANTDAAVAACPERSRPAVLTIIQDLHRIHGGRRPHHLSRPLQQYLGARRGTGQCPRCGVRL